MASSDASDAVILHLRQATQIVIDLAVAACVATACERLDLARVFQAATHGPADLRAFVAAIARQAAQPAGVRDWAVTAALKLCLASRVIRSCTPVTAAPGMSDVQRFEAFLRAHQDRVFATAARLVGRSSDAEDIAQTTFLRAWERFDALRDNPAAGGWLTTVATNLALNHLSRHRSRWRLFSELAGDDPGEPGFDATLAAGEPGEDPLATADEHARLERALRALPPHQRVPIVLFHFDEQSYEQIAARLRVSVGKIKTDIHRGRLALRAALRSPDGPR